MAHLTVETRGTYGVESNGSGDFALQHCHWESTWDFLRIGNAMALSALWALLWCYTAFPATDPTRQCACLGRLAGVPPGGPVQQRPVGPVRRQGCSPGGLVNPRVGFVGRCETYWTLTLCTVYFLVSVVPAATLCCLGDTFVLDT